MFSHSILQNTVFRKVAMSAAVAIGCFMPANALADPDIYVVTFTAEWCPNCKILDPKVDGALSEFDEDDVEHIVLDMTDGDTRLDAFDEVDGTVLAGVYGDHLGVTGIAMLTAADSGEKIGCATRVHSETEIVEMINKAREIVTSQAPYARQNDLGNCPIANQKVEM